MKRSIVWGILFLGTINFRIFGMSSVGYESAYNIAETREMERQAAMQRQQEEALARAGRVGAYERAYAVGQPDFSGARERQRRAEERAMREERVSAYGRPWKRTYMTGGERAIETADLRRQREEELMGAYREGQLREAPEFVRPVQEVERPSAKQLEAMRKEEAAVKEAKAMTYALAQDPEYAQKMARLDDAINRTEKEAAYSRAYAEEIDVPGYREEAARKEQAAVRAARSEREMAYYGGSRSRLQAIRDYTNDMWRYINTANLAGDVKARALAALARADRLFKEAWEEAGKQTAAARCKASELMAAGLDALRKFKSYMPQVQLFGTLPGPVAGEPSAWGAGLSRAEGKAAVYRGLVKSFNSPNLNKDSIQALGSLRRYFIEFRNELLVEPTLNEEITKQIVPFLVRKLVGSTAIDYVNSYIKKLDAYIAKL